MTIRTTHQGGSPILLAGVVGALAAALVIGNYASKQSAELEAINLARARAQLTADVQQMQTRTETESFVQQSVRIGATILVIGGSIASATLLVGGATAIVRYLNQRATSVYAGVNGMYPLKVVQNGRRSVLIDPNRLIHPVTHYGAQIQSERSPARLTHTDAPEDQVRVTTQAQAVQLATAAATGRGGDVAPMARQLLSAAQDAPSRMPQIQILPADERMLNHLDRMLAERTPN